MIPLPSCFLDKPLFAQLAANSSCTHGSVVHARFQRRNGPIRALCADSGVLITGETGRGLQPEILALGHHIGVLHRSVKRPKFNSADRFLWAGLYGVWNNWWSTCCSFKASIVIGGHRKGFRPFWTWKIRCRKWGRPVPGIQFHKTARNARPVIAVSGEIDGKRAWFRG
jgi:hypothetical protein